MASPSRVMHGRTTCTVDVSPDLVDAGAELTLQCKVSCSPGCDLRGHTLSIQDQAGTDVATVELTEYAGEANRTRRVVVKAPVEQGQCTWLVVCPAIEREGTSYTEGSAPISFTVKAHTTSVVTWDIPSAIAAGARFRMKVGIKCSSGCDLTNRAFAIVDHDGTRMAAATLPGGHWPDTTGLHVAEVELQAPAAEGLYTWSVISSGSDLGIPHAQGSIGFGVRVVSHPQHRVTVEAIDRVTQVPLAGARVVLHPYHAVTDERGIAEIRVAKGVYRLFVSQTRYQTFGLPVEVTADVTARAELDVEVVPERN